MIKRISFWQAAMHLLLLLKTDESFADQYTVDWVQTGFFERRDLASGIVVDSHGFPLVRGATGPVYGTNPATLGNQLALVARYDQSGQKHWLVTAYPSENLDHVLGMEIDQNNNVFIAGETYRYRGAEAYLVKYGSQGQVLWERHLGTSDNEFGRDVAVDASGNAYLLGSTTGVLAGAFNTGYDPFIAKYSPTGDLLLLRQYTDDALSNIPSAIAVHDDDIFVAGTSGALASALTKMDAGGNVIWSVRPNYATATGQATQIYDIVVDDAGSIYTCGFTDSVYDNARGFQGADAVVAKHGPDGALIWQRRLETGEFDQFSSVQVDAWGDVYLAGTKTDSRSIIVGDHDAIWAKFDAQGGLLWQQQYGTQHADYGAGIAVDSDRNVYLAGASSWTVNDYYAGESDAFLIRYSFIVPEPSSDSLLLNVAVISAMVFGRISSNRRIVSGYRIASGAPEPIISDSSIP